MVRRTEKVVAAVPPSMRAVATAARCAAATSREHVSLVALMNATAPDLPYLLPIHRVGACLGAPTANPHHRPHVHGAPPILVSNALHDPATGYPWAVSVARQLGRSGVLLSYEGHGHGSVTGGPCMEDAADSYLTDLAVPPAPPPCRPDGVPIRAAWKVNPVDGRS